ncbi:signal peptidase I [Staphylococcus epidermidis]|uniref:signal peptidase I n=1 Tax=Staphylococcus epidermidis TaxID=1282 RepID=UPI00035509F0|nr:signal peptidase I [Staphylococcus epidermidis]EPP69295.1 signal peptidase IB [Staphylococcus epidermidis Scl22]ESR04135.1 signal peptidase IB [Staphylococcus epidermidis CIM28]ESR26624.1 signal peptidase IB [Staphylococcus epidermidis APO35]ESU02762.1 signal peptidase IB [Staphylococcus epidermidis CIM37]ESV09858.1 signal peptidase IB [Staphylococcus epidermidis MC28]
MKKEIQEWVIAIIVTVLLLALVNTFLIKTYTVSGLSMYPTFNNKDRVIVSKISKSLNHLNSGDVIIFHKNKNNDFIKRLIGKPGDQIEYKNDKLYINKKYIKESYLTYNKKTNDSGDSLTENFKVSDIEGSKHKITIPKDKYLVLGDNRANSVDSRSSEVGLVSKKRIVGKVILRFWPFSDMQYNFKH